MLEEFRRALEQATMRIIDGIANFLPGALVLLVLVVGSLVVALATRYVLLRMLRSLDVDRRAELLGVSALADWSPTRSPSQVIATTAYWSILLLGLLIGLTALDAAVPSRFAMSVFQYLPHLMAAALTLLVGGMLARFLGRAVLIGAVNMGIQSARLMSLAVKWLVLTLAAAMALEQVGIGQTILMLAFAIAFGGIVLAVSLAVGLGAKDVVGRALERQLREPAPSEDKLDHI